VIFELVVQGEPATKGRPRVGKGRRIYTPQTTRDAEATIGWEARAVLGARAANEVDGLHVEIDFYASTRQRRDLDNMAKLVLDALNGIVWRDDDQIIALTLTKAIDTRPRTEVRVYVKEPRGRQCQTCEGDLSRAEGRDGRPSSARRLATTSPSAKGTTAHAPVAGRRSTGRFEARPVPTNRHVRGQCADCGTPTYNPTATRCRPCFLDARAA
jgi:Holliday junction resolvase RusA-like endonuclease